MTNGRQYPFPNHPKHLNNYRMSTYIKNQTGGILDSTNICWMCPCVWSGELSCVASNSLWKFQLKGLKCPLLSTLLYPANGFYHLGDILSQNITTLTPSPSSRLQIFILPSARFRFEKKFLCIHLSRCLIIIKDKLQCVNLIPENVSSLEELYSLNRFAGD